ncbi:MAG: S8 family serine peptidase [Ilumatobacteraceae bacterium]
MDSANRGVLAVGAIDPVGSESIADYSSRGPTNDGRIKPDVAADSGLSTSVYGSAGFRGTSGQRRWSPGSPRCSSTPGWQRRPRAWPPW